MTNKEAYEEAAGMLLDPMFFILNNIDPDAEFEEHYCHADKDGDCNFPGCPQIKDDEPEKSGRSCPWDKNEEEEW